MNGLDLNIDAHKEGGSYKTESPKENFKKTC